MRSAVIVAAVVLALATFTIAFAHAEPAIVKPGDGAVLAQAPTEVQIQMTQEMARQAGANDIEVFDVGGNKVTTVSANIDNSDRRKISVPLPSNLAVGSYTVKWKTLSADDGDPANGELVFTYDPAKTPFVGNENLVDTGIEPATPTTAAPGSVAGLDRGDPGTSWVLVIAVAVGMFALGSGSTYLLVNKKPS